MKTSKLNLSKKTVSSFTQSTANNKFSTNTTNLTSLTTTSSGIFDI